MPECLTKCYTNHTILGETSWILKTTNEEKRIHIKDINYPHKRYQFSVSLAPSSKEQKAK